MFKPNRKFRKEYDKVFQKDPMAANVLLLLCELADGREKVQTNEKELAQLMTARFGDGFKEYQL